ncbi:MAG: hypothetical protein ACK5MZ_11600 [Aestuariibaculum sp.]
MKKNDLDTLFENLKNSFDIEEPNSQHKQRFLDKLNKQVKLQIKTNKPKRHLLKPLIGMAAAIVLLFGLFLGLQEKQEKTGLASVSPKMAQTQDFFTSTINNELKRIQKELAPEAQQLIQDALKQIKVLENDYKNLETDLSESGNDNRVIYAMISNFQNRINILQNTLKQIQTVKEINHKSHEKSSTI